jgi:hypothetical protein
VATDDLQPIHLPKIGRNRWHMAKNAVGLGGDSLKTQ